MSTEPGQGTRDDRDSGEAHASGGRSDELRQETRDVARASGPSDGRAASHGDPAAPRGADLARQVLAAAKADARARARAVGGRGANGAAGDEPRSGQRPAAPGEDDREPPRRPRLPGIAAPGREWREPTSLGAAMERMLAARGWRSKAADSSVLARWDTIVGPDISAHATPVSLRDGVLELAAESTAWATQLRFLAARILGELRRELGPDVVTRINVRGPSAPSWRHGPVQMPGSRGPRDTYG